MTDIYGKEVNINDKVLVKSLYSDMYEKAYVIGQTPKKIKSLVFEQEIEINVMNVVLINDYTDEIIDFMIESFNRL